MTVRKLRLLAATASVPVQAHPGHEPFSEGAKHFISNQNHFLPALIFASAIFLAARFLPRRAERLFTRVLAATIVVTALLT